MSMISEQYKEKVGLAVGYDMTNASQSALIGALIDAAVSDMEGAGVSESILSSKPLALTTLIIFVTDNLNMTPGNFVTSPMYNANVVKLRLMPDVK